MRGWSTPYTTSDNTGAKEFHMPLQAQPLASPCEPLSSTAHPAKSQGLIVPLRRLRTVQAPQFLHPSNGPSIIVWRLSACPVRHLTWELARHLVIFVANHDKEGAFASTQHLEYSVAFRSLSGMIGCHRQAERPRRALRWTRRVAKLPSQHLFLSPCIDGLLSLTLDILPLVCICGEACR